MRSQLGLLLLIAATVSLAAAVRFRRNHDFDDEERSSMGGSFGPPWSPVDADSWQEAAHIRKEDFEEDLQEGFVEDEDEGTCPSRIYMEWTRQEVDKLAGAITAQLKTFEDRIRARNAADEEPKRRTISIGILSGIVLAVVLFQIFLSYEVKLINERRDELSHRISTLRECMARDFRTLEGRLQRSEEWVINELETMASQLPELADVVSRERTLLDTLEKRAFDVKMRESPSGTPDIVCTQAAPSSTSGSKDMEIELNVEVLMDKEKQSSHSNQRSPERQPHLMNQKNSSSAASE